MSKIFEALERARDSKESSAPIDLAPLSRSPHETAADLIALKSPDSYVAESFRFLRAKITRPVEGKPPRTILVASALMGEGKTFVACNIAVSISQSLEEYVLLIDADLRSPSIHGVFGIHPAKEGLSTYLSRQAPLEGLLRKTSLKKLSILPAGNSSLAPAEMLSSERMKLLISEVRDRYSDRFVIIDSSPMELTPESAVLANEVDAVILVVRHGKTPRDAVKSALGRIKKDKLLGVVYNGYDESDKRYGDYGYHEYGYGKKKK